MFSLAKKALSFENTARDFSKVVQKMATSCNGEAECSPSKSEDDRDKEEKEKRGAAASKPN